MKFSKFFSLLSFCFVLSILCFSTSCSDEDDVNGRNIYLGVYDGDEECDDDMGDGHNFSVTERGEDGNDVYLGNLTGRNLQLNGVVDGNSISVPEQIVDDVTISGSGNREDNDDLTILYTTRINLDSIVVCSIEGDKQ